MPLTPSQSFMALSKDALTSHRPSGENCTYACIGTSVMLGEGALSLFEC